jgi:site-specific recombinase XerC
MPPSAFSSSSRRRSATGTLRRAGSSRLAGEIVIAELADIEPIHVAAYIESLDGPAAKPTVKQHLAAIRMLFDWLVVGQILAVNPAHAVRGPKHVVRRGKDACFD